MKRAESLSSVPGCNRQPLFVGLGHGGIINIMAITRKEVDAVNNKYRYLPFKVDVLKTGKCAEGPCMAYRPGEHIFCVSTEPPLLQCPLFKRRPLPKQKQEIIPDHQLANNNNPTSISNDSDKQCSFKFVK
jgi:hypothetical protein